MRKPLAEGKIIVKGKEIAYKFYRNGRLKGGKYNNYIVAEYKGKRIIIEDHGHGFEHAKGLLKNEINIRMKK